MRKINCFIACAFDKSDVEIIYNKAIISLLKRKKIECFRVDKVEHNQDIDDKIIELMKYCDICIADLTYARPSVYFEAGYFKGKNKEVVFTVRQDHFKPKENDINGNLRVHFDLQMKNIIGWDDLKNYKTFQSKLNSRIDYILKPLIKKLQNDEEEYELIKEYQKMSVSRKNELIQNKLLQIVIKNKLNEIKPNLTTYYLPDMYKSYVKGKKVICLFIYTSGTKENLKYVNAERIIYQHKDVDFKEMHIAIYSIRKIPKTRIDDLYPDIEAIDEAGETYLTTVRDRFKREKEYKCYYHFKSGFKSVKDINNSMNEMFGIFNKKARKK